MERVYLTYLGHCMEIPQGDSIVGRGVSCRMRFNDPSLSRVHCRLRVKAGLVTVADMNSTNGTLVNGRQIEQPTELKNGDTIQIGDRELTVVITRAESLFEESTVTFSELPPPPARTTAGTDRQQRCPDCRNPVSAEEDLCPHCGYAWTDFRPGAVTQNFVRLERAEMKAERRRHARHRVRVPVVYSSSQRSFESVAINISRGGLFVRTRDFDEVGTYCEVTIMADGAPALSLPARVAYRLDKPEKGAQLGLGLEFRDLGVAERRWLDDTIARLGSV